MIRLIMMLGMFTVNIYTMKEDHSDDSNDQLLSPCFRNRSYSKDSTDSVKITCLKSCGFDSQDDYDLESRNSFNSDNDSDEEVIYLTSAVSRSASIDASVIRSSSERTDSSGSQFSRRSDTPFMIHGRSQTGYPSRFKSPIGGILDKKDESHQVNNSEEKALIGFFLASGKNKGSASGSDVDSPRKEEDAKTSISLQAELIFRITERSGGVNSSSKEKFAKNKKIDVCSSDCKSSNCDDENFSGMGKRKR